MKKLLSIILTLSALLCLCLSVSASAQWTLSVDESRTLYPDVFHYDDAPNDNYYTSLYTADSAAKSTYNADQPMGMSKLGLGLIIAVTVIVGYLVPVAVLAIGLVLPRTKKFGYTKRWYALSVLAAIWIVLSTVIVMISVI